MKLTLRGDPLPESPPVKGFDLTAWRTGRIAQRRRGSRQGLLVALMMGVVGSFVLQWWSVRQLTRDGARTLRLEQRLATFTPMEHEAARLEHRIARGRQQAVLRRALEPRRRRLVELLDTLGATAQEGIALTSIQLGVKAEGGLQAQVAGLADDADAVARWASRLTKQPEILAVELEDLRRLDLSESEPGATPGMRQTLKSATLSASHASAPVPTRPALRPQVLNAFRVRLRLSDGSAETRPADE